MTPIRIMLVDSNRTYVRSMQETLQRESDLDVVATSNNGSEALKAALCAQPDVLITDLVMPVLDGFALMESLSKARLDARIIVLTELTRDCFIRQAMALGAYYYMVKPVDPSILIRRVRDSLNFSQQAPLAVGRNARLHGFPLPALCGRPCVPDGEALRPHHHRNLPLHRAGVPDRPAQCRARHPPRDSIRLGIRQRAARREAHQRRVDRPALQAVLREARTVLRLSQTRRLHPAPAR